MLNFEDIRIRDLVFFERLTVVGSITSTAKEMGVPKATASRWLANLEERVGHSLIKRTTRSFALTEIGHEFAIHVREILSAISMAQVAIQPDNPTGTLRVSVPGPMGMFVGPVIASFRRRLPSVRLEIMFQNERVDLIRDRFDLAIRGGPLPDSGLIARKLSTASMWLYMSAKFRDTPLSAVPLITTPQDAQLLRRSTFAEQLSAPVVLVDDRTAMADALVWGAGVGLLPSFLGEPPRREGTLHKVDEEPIATLPIHAVYHESQRKDPRLKALIEEIAKQLNRVLE